MATLRDGMPNSAHYGFAWFVESQNGHHVVERRDGIHHGILTRKPEVALRPTFDRRCRRANDASAPDKVPMMCPGNDETRKPRVGA
jgi:hypothetical protein